MRLRRPSAPASPIGGRERSPTLSLLRSPPRSPPVDNAIGTIFHETREATALGATSNQVLEGAEQQPKQECALDLYREGGDDGGQASKEGLVLCVLHGKWRHPDRVARKANGDWVCTGDDRCIGFKHVDQVPSGAGRSKGSCGAGRGPGKGSTRNRSPGQGKNKPPSMMHTRLKLSRLRLGLRRELKGDGDRVGKDAGRDHVVRRPRRSLAAPRRAQLSQSSKMSRASGTDPPPPPPAPITLLPRPAERPWPASPRGTRPPAPPSPPSPPSLLTLAAPAEPVGFPPGGRGPRQEHRGKGDRRGDRDGGKGRSKGKRAVGSGGGAKGARRSKGKGKDSHGLPPPPAPGARRRGGGGGGGGDAPALPPAGMVACITHGKNRFIGRMEECEGGWRCKASDRCRNAPGGSDNP